MEATIEINKQQVYDEVAKTTAYVAHKMEIPEGASDPFDRIATTDENAEMLDRFFDEAAHTATDTLKEWLASEPDHTDGITYTLNLTDNFRLAVLGSMRSSLFSYFVDTICAKWFLLTNKTEAEAYTSLATAHLDDVTAKLYHRVRPSRPNDGTPAPLIYP